MTTAVNLEAPERLGRDVARVLMQGDLSHLSPDQKVNYYLKVCESLGLNPYTKPFDYLKLNGREILYARKDATDQLRSTRKVSIVNLERQRMDDLMVVTATARMPDGRSDSAIGAVPIQGLKGDALANALMKAETKAKRRVTLSICGLGLTDESEIDTIPGAQINGPVYTPDEMGAHVDSDGVVIDIPAAPPMDTAEVQAKSAEYDRIIGAAAEEELPLRERDVEDRRPARSELWQENRRLSNKAAELGIQNVPVIQQRSSDDALMQANADIAGRIRAYEAGLESTEESLL